MESFHGVMWAFGILWKPELKYGNRNKGVHALIDVKNTNAQT